MKNFIRDILREIDPTTRGHKRNRLIMQVGLNGRRDWWWAYYQRYTVTKMSEFPITIILIIMCPRLRFQLWKSYLNHGNGWVGRNSSQVLDTSPVFWGGRRNSLVKSLHCVVNIRPHWWLDLDSPTIWTMIMVGDWTDNHGHNLYLPCHLSTLLEGRCDAMQIRNVWMNKLRYPLADTKQLAVLRSNAQRSSPYFTYTPAE